MSIKDTLMELKTLPLIILHYFIILLLECPFSRGLSDVCVALLVFNASIRNDGEKRETKSARVFI
jgi:hypothetical protein